jgi:hypothetical protein
MGAEWVSEQGCSLREEIRNYRESHPDTSVIQPIVCLTIGVLSFYFYSNLFYLIFVGVLGYCCI